MTELTQIDDFDEIINSGIPLLDTRAPIEYKNGAFPNTSNLPLMNDSERELVGTCYKNNGKEMAIELGHELVNGEIKDSRINDWLYFIKNNPSGALYCFRGGMRSEIVQKWIFEYSGKDYPRVKGGYKALRRYLIDETSRVIQKTIPILLGGKTGSGKTILLNKINNKVDLEALANHRGSAFGNNITPQPTQIDFENKIGYELVKKQSFINLVFEDEGSNIGNIQIPKCIQERTSLADMILLDESIDNRIAVSLNEYVIGMCNNFINQDNENGFDNFSDYWLQSINKIKKRLGLERYKEMLVLVNQALSSYKKDNKLDGFYVVIEKLLTGYYDPMYEYQIKRKQDRIVFAGNSDEVLDYFSDLSIS